MLIITLDNDENFLPLSEMNIGRSTMVELHEDGFISDYDQTKVLEATREFDKRSLQYVLIKMVFKDEFWAHAVWINFLNRGCKLFRKQVP